MTECLKYKTGSTGKEKDYITREGIFRHMWMNTELTDDHKKYIYDKYPNIWELHCCIKEFRNIFKNRNVPLLYLFVEKYSNSSIKALKSFADGLKRDIDAVENAVAYNFSNGFVEGTNSRLKMIKRSMYGRCGKQLLEAKLRYTKAAKTDNCGRTCRTVIFTSKRHPLKNFDYPYNTSFQYLKFMRCSLRSVNNPASVCLYCLVTGSSESPEIITRFKCCNRLSVYITILRIFVL